MNMISMFILLATAYQTLAVIVFLVTLVFGLINRGSNKSTYVEPYKYQPPEPLKEKKMFENKQVIKAEPEQPKVEQIESEEMKAAKRMHILNDTEASIITDDFTKTWRVEVTKISGRNASDLPFFRLSTESNSYHIPSVYLTFRATQSLNLMLFTSNTLYLAQGDQFTFLFDNDTSLQCRFEHARKGDKNAYRNSFILSDDYMQIFIKHSVTKCKSESARKGEYDIVGPMNNKWVSYQTADEGKYLLRLMALKVLSTKVNMLENGQRPIT